MSMFAPDGRAVNFYRGAQSIMRYVAAAALISLSFIPLFAEAAYVDVRPDYDSTRWTQCDQYIQESIQQEEDEARITITRGWSGIAYCRRDQNPPVNLWIISCQNTDREKCVIRTAQWDDIEGRVVGGFVTNKVPDHHTDNLRWFDENTGEPFYVCQREICFYEPASEEEQIEERDDLGLPETTEPGLHGEPRISGGQRTWVQVAGDVLENIALESVAVVVWFLTEIFVWVFKGLLAIVGGIFGFIVQEFVIEMGKYVTASNATAVREAWTLIRDLANIAIIGGLVATAIGTIIGAQNYSVQKNLARLILAALLVNFSYFVAGAIIDFSNFTAHSAYKAVVCETADDSCSIFDRFFMMGRSGGERYATGFFEAVENAFGNEGLAEQGAEEEFNETFVGSGSDDLDAWRPSIMATINIMLIIFYGVTGFVFLSAISLLIARFIALIFLLITSPIGIAGLAVPFLKKYADEWWKAIGSQSLFAPVYFLLVGISLNILVEVDSTVQLMGRESGTTLTAGLQGVVSVSMLFIIAIGFMWAALSVAKSMSAEATRFKELYEGVQKYITKPIGSTFGREIIGRVGDAFGTGYTRFLGKPKEEFSKGLRGRLARGTQTLLKKSPLGRGGELVLKGIAGAKFGGKESFEEARKRRVAREADIEGTGKLMSALKDVSGKEAEVKRLEREAEGSGDPEKILKAKQAREAFNRAKSELDGKVADLTPESLNRLRDRREWDKLRKFIPYMSESQFKQYAHDKEIPKNIRNQFHEIRMQKLKGFTELAQGRILATKEDGSIDFDEKGHAKYRAITDADIEKQRAQAAQDIKAGRLAEAREAAIDQFKRSNGGKAPDDKQIADLVKNLPPIADATAKDIDDLLGNMNLKHFMGGIADGRGRYTGANNSEVLERARAAAIADGAKPTDADFNDRVAAEAREMTFGHLQGQLYTLFKYGGVSKGDIVTFIKHDPSLLDNETLFDGGMTHGSKMAIYESPELTFSQREQAALTWSVNNDRKLTAANIELGIDLQKEIEGNGFARKINDLSAKATQGDAEAAREMQALVGTLQSSDSDFAAAVTRMKQWLAGKQPHEVAGQVRDMQMLSPAFAASISGDALGKIVETHDPTYWKPMINNLMALIKAGYGKDDEATQARLKGVFEYFASSAGQGNGMNSALLEAMVMVGIDQKGVEKNLGGPVRWALG